MHQHDLRRGQRADGHQDHSRDHQVEPCQQRHAKHRHAFATHADGGGDDVDRGADGAESGDDQRQRPVVRAVPARECALGKRRISPPGDIGRAAGSLQAHAADEAVVQHQAAQRGHPEAEGIHPGKGHIPGADHQGNQVIGKSDDQRHAHEKDHGGAVHGEDAVEDLRGEKVVVRHGQLNAQ